MPLATPTESYYCVSGHVLRKGQELPTRGFSLTEDHVPTALLTQQVFDNVNVVWK